MMGGDSGVPYAAQLTPIFLRCMKDPDDELRNNSVYALGVLVTTSNGALAPYPSATSTISPPSLLPNLLASCPIS